MSLLDVHSAAPARSSRLRLVQVALALAMSAPDAQAQSSPASGGAAEPRPPAELIVYRGVQRWNDGQYAAACADFRDSQRLQPNPSTLLYVDRCHEQAVMFFDRGREFLKQGRSAEACGAFAESQALEPYPTKLLHLGNCHARDHRPASAIRTFEQVFELLSLVRDPKQREALETEARARIAELKPKVATLQFHASLPRDAVVRLEGQALPVGVDLSLDPGEYRLEVSAPGHQTLRQRLRLALGQRLDYPLPALAPELSEPDEGSRFGLAPLVLTSAGAVLAGAGTYLGLRAMASGRRLRRDCQVGVENARCNDLENEWKSRADTATWVWVGAGLLAGTGITLYVLEAQGSSSGSTGASARLNAWAGPGMAGVGASGRF